MTWGIATCQSEDFLARICSISTPDRFPNYSGSVQHPDAASKRMIGNESIADLLKSEHHFLHLQHLRCPGLVGTLSPFLLGSKRQGIPSAFGKPTA